MAEIKISDIQAGMSNIEVRGKLTKLGERRQVQTKFGPADVATATLEDETGSINLSLWRQQIDLVNEGDNIKLTNAFVRTFGGQPILNIGRGGQIIKEKTEDKV
jgi:replication factor A1